MTRNSGPTAVSQDHEPGKSEGQAALQCKGGPPFALEATGRVQRERGSRDELLGEEQVVFLEEPPVA
ncbi:hypothetical protein EES40_11085 [Streptomyces sp. ADI93-02]|nr:hypothetical protein EES40_11085 [Streptomyces sp. ADI93-02]